MNGELECWACGANNTEATNITGPTAPAEGDVGVCLYCRAIGVFTGDGHRRRMPTSAELDEFDGDERIPIAMRLATRVHAGMRGAE